MKKCRRCSKPATLHITEIHEASAVAIHLCDSCAREYLDSDEIDPSANPAAELAAKIDELVAEGDESLNSSCSNCGLTFNGFRENGRLGCPTCYDDFRDDLMPLLENIHEESEHQGKFPSHNPELSEDQAELIQLKAKQKEAIAKEDYETAAMLRDKISKIDAAAQTGGTEQDTSEPSLSEDSDLSLIHI